MTRATVVGSGPNGLAAAIVLAEQGLDVTVLEASATIGGGTRSAELTVPGLVHDVCSAIHPFGVLSPCFGSFDLGRHGLRWAWADIELAHPLDDGSAGVLSRSVDATASGLGGDGPSWSALFGPLAATIDALDDDLLRPIQHLPHHPVHLVRFGLRALQPATWVARRWQGEPARALFTGAAAHSFQPLSRPTTAAAGLILVAAAHAAGWPVAVGGSQAIAAALASKLGELGGTIETGVTVTSLTQLPDGLVLLDVAPRAVIDLAGDRLPKRVRRAYERWRHGPAAFKLDLAVEDGVPWTNEACRRAGTVHVGGTARQVALAEADASRGRMPERPFVLVGQQYLADPDRSAGDVHPVWTYAHVPHGCDGDATEAILRQLERFAPGVRERIVASEARGPRDIEQHNPNYVGGDISAGANSPWQVVVRPRPAIDPYATGIPGVYICSAATPPGAGVHGMCGANAARSALPRSADREWPLTGGYPRPQSVDSVICIHGRNCWSGCGLMVRWLISIALHLGANAIALWVADLVLDDMSIEWQAFIVAVAIFTVVEIIADPLITKMALRSAPALRGSVALVTTFIGLLVTDVLSDGMNIDGAATWVFATIIVWLGGLIAGLLLPVIFVKRAVTDEDERRRGTTYAP